MNFGGDAAYSQPWHKKGIYYIFELGLDRLAEVTIKILSDITPAVALVLDLLFFMRKISRKEQSTIYNFLLGLKPKF